MLTYFNCAEKSSLVSSSSQLSSQRCVLLPGTSVSSCVQSVAIEVSFGSCLVVNVHGSVQNEVVEYMTRLK
jgi:hypothetical protein